MGRISGLVATIALLLAGAPQAASAETKDEEYYMADVGATIRLPPSWKTTRWSDWDFKAEADDHSMMMWLFYTPWQVEVSPDHAKAWAEVHIDKLKEAKAGDFKVVRAAPTSTGTTADIEINFKFNGDGPPGVYQATVIPGLGKNIHIATLSGARHAPRAKKALDQMVQQMSISQKPADLASVTGLQEAKAGFGVELKDGWRLPVGAEIKDIQPFLEKTGHKEADPEKCVQAIHPVPVGDPDYMLLCQSRWFLGHVDAHSWKGVEAQVHEKFFGNSAAPVPTADQWPFDDRLGFLYAPSAGNTAIRMGMVPYDQGLVVTWALAQANREKDLDSQVRALSKTLRFTGPDNGKPVIGFGQWLSYYLQYRKTSPAVLGPVILLLLVLGGITVKVTRKPKPTPMY